MSIWSSQIPSRVHDLFQWFFRVINWICAWLKVLNHEHFQTALIITTQLSLSYILFEGWKKYMIMYIKWNLWIRNVYYVHMWHNLLCPIKNMPFDMWDWIQLKPMLDGIDSVVLFHYCPHWIKPSLHFHHLLRFQFFEMAISI